MASRRPTSCIGLSLAAALVGCAEGGAPDTPAASVRDSAGVRIVTSARPAHPGHALLGPPELTVGDRPGDPAHELGRVAGAVRLSDGGVAVLDGQAQTVRLFGPDGAHRADAGREGEGPGELRRGYQLALLPGDTLRVDDGGNQRIQLFDADGAPAGGYRLQDPVSGGLFSFTAALRGGRDVGQVRADDRGLQEMELDDGLGSFPGLILLLDRTRGALDTVLAGTMMQFRQMDDFAVSPVFGHRLRSAAAGRWLAAAATERWEILRLDADAGERTLLRYPPADVPVSAHELDTLRERSRRAVEEAGRPFDDAGFWDLDAQPATRPAFDEIRVDREGRVWANRFEPGSATSPVWYVFAPDGTLLTELTLPPSSRLWSVSPTHAVLEVRDELDVPTVEVRPIRWPEG